MKPKNKKDIQLSIIDGIIFNKRAELVPEKELVKIKASIANWGKFKQENGSVVHWTKKKLDQVSFDVRENFIRSTQDQ